MKCVALVSGGKDSVLALHLTEAFGHDVVAIAHLSPRDGQDETDSYMYQSVGSKAVEAIAAHCIPELPFYLERIRGKPIEVASNEYVCDELENEVEDLYRLLSRVKETQPEVVGVVSGAIFSTYQKRRVEHCCRRLGLKSLAPLWGWNQLFLLRHLVEFWAPAHFDVRLLKSATMGLGREDLMRSLASSVPKLLTLYKKFNINVCGEGGEFETLTLSAPCYKRTLRVVTWNAKADGEDRLDPVWYAQVETCAPGEVLSTEDFKTRIMDHSGLRLLRLTLELGSHYINDTAMAEAMESPFPKLHCSPRPPRQAAATLLDAHLSVNGEHRPLADFGDIKQVIHGESSSLWTASQADVSVSSVRFERDARDFAVISDCYGYLPHLSPELISPTASEKMRSNYDDPRLCAVELLLCLRQMRNELWTLTGRSSSSLVINLTVQWDKSVHPDCEADFAAWTKKYVDTFRTTNEKWTADNGEAAARWQRAGLFALEETAESQSVWDSVLGSNGREAMLAPWTVSVEMNADLGMAVRVVVKDPIAL